jgi:hypothetical protein
MEKRAPILTVALIGVALICATPSLLAQSRGASKDPALIQKKNAFPLVPDTPMALTIPPLGTRDQKTGSALVVRAISENAELNAPRMMALGVLGSQMLDAPQHVTLGYQSLFGALGKGCKLDAAAHSEIRFAGATNNDDGTVDVPMPPTSLVAKREAMMYALAENLRSRLVLDDKGSPAASARRKTRSSRATSSVRARSSSSSMRQASTTRTSSTSAGSSPPSCRGRESRKPSRPRERSRSRFTARRSRWCRRSRRRGETTRRS